MQEMRVWSLGQEDPLEKEMSTCSRILAWKIPWIEEPGGLLSTGLQRVGHNWATEHTHHLCIPKSMKRHATSPSNQRCAVSLAQRRTSGGAFGKYLQMVPINSCLIFTYPREVFWMILCGTKKSRGYVLYIFCLTKPGTNSWFPIKATWYTSVPDYWKSWKP